MRSRRRRSPPESPSESRSPRPLPQALVRGALHHVRTHDPVPDETDGRELHDGEKLVTHAINTHGARRVTAGEHKSSFVTARQ